VQHSLSNRRAAAVGAAILAISLACSGGALAGATEPNSAGDIPDSQAFVTFRSPSGGYLLDVPEGWARSVHGPDVQFRSKLDAVAVSLRRVAGVPSEEDLRAAAVDGLPASRKAMVQRVRRLRVGGADVTLVHFVCHSEPDPVTERSVELGNDAYLFYRDHRSARILLSAPVGADNADQWNRIVKSFRWR
jgi:hypothetical protein